MDRVIKWEDVSFIISSSYRYKVLKNLERPKTPSTLSKELNINKTHISRTLSDMVLKNIITCLTPKVTKGKLYIISEYGKIVLKEIEKQKY